MYLIFKNAEIIPNMKVLSSLGVYTRGPLVYVYDSEGTHAHVYGLKGGPHAHQNNLG